MKLFRYLTPLICILFLTACNKSTDTIKIGIIEPMEHVAMDEIVAGFSDTLRQLYKKPVTIKVENAQNDPNLQRAIVQKMRDSDYDIVLPIGVDATQMTLSMVHKPVVSLASDLTEADRRKLKACNVGVVHDEVSPQQVLEFIRTAFPNIKNLVLIHSSANKVLPEVEKTITIGKLYCIKIEQRMVSTLPELINVSNNLPKNTQGIIILKDHLIVSGIATLAKAAANRGIPLFTSDEGSVEVGAGLALGVHEKEIGVQGAKLAASILSGKPACELPILEMTDLTVFVNPDQLQRSNQSLDPIVQAAQKLHYKTEVVSTK